jgi:PEP-CTERM motif-containing protein
MKPLLACLFAVVLSARCVFADPIVIQAGSFAGAVDLGGFTGPSWDLRGDAFHLTGLFAGKITGSPCPCAPGTTLSLTHGANMSGHGDVTLGAQVFSNVDLLATFNVRSPTTITLPSTIKPQAGFAFTFDYRLAGNIIGLRGGDTLFTQSIIGTGSGGVANFQPLVLPDGTAKRYRDVANFYNFGTFTPTPEPASLLLIATGAAMILRRRSRERSPLRARRSGAGSMSM